MLKTGSKEGLDPAKGKKTAARVKVVDQIKNKQSTPAPFAKAKKGEEGRKGSGRFNREFAVQKDALLNGEPMVQKPDFKKRDGPKGASRGRGGMSNSRGRGGSSRGGGKPSFDRKP